MPKRAKGGSVGLGVILSLDTRSTKRDSSFHVDHSYLASRTNLPDLPVIGTVDDYLVTCFDLHISSYVKRCPDRAKPRYARLSSRIQPSLRGQVGKRV
jgi:hypothetical protein